MRRMSPLRFVFFIITVTILVLRYNPGWQAHIPFLAALGEGLSNVPKESLTAARAKFITHLSGQLQDGSDVDVPPQGVDLELVKYSTDLGDFPAYVTPERNDGQKHPAIIWIAGGFSNSIGDMWSPESPDNDQSASCFRQAGIITMYPSLRGGNKNAGSKETFYGEVNDVLDAEKYLLKRPDVDPNRIYLGGHSTGGTLVLLVAESTDKFRAIFSFGPVGKIDGYGQENANFTISDEKEVQLRSPIYWLKDITKPTFVFEGDSGRSNIGELFRLKANTTNPLIHFYPISGKSHFSELYPTSVVVARKIVADTDDKPIEFKPEEIGSR